MAGVWGVVSSFNLAANVTKLNGIKEAEGRLLDSFGFHRGGSDKNRNPHRPRPGVHMGARPYEHRVVAVQTTIDSAIGRLIRGDRYRLDKDKPRGSEAPQ